MTGDPAPLTGTVDQALWNASRLILKAPQSAVEQTEEILRASPDHLGAMLLLARALRNCGAHDRASEIAQKVRARAPQSSAAVRELALINLATGNYSSAGALLNNAIEKCENDVGTWSLLAELRRHVGDIPGAESATRKSISIASRDLECLAAGQALNEERLPEAEQLLRLRLLDFPTDVISIRMMAELATRLSRFGDAENLLRRALELAPYFDPARELLARNLQRMNRPEDALLEVECLVQADPTNPSVQMLKASLLVKVGDQEAAQLVYEAILERHPKQAKTWMSLGHVFKTLGKQADAVIAYRRAIRENPTLGEAWWSLANLKTYRFAPEDVSAMEAALGQTVDDEDRLHLHFALGKAQEDAGRYQDAIRNWMSANTLRRKSLPYDRQATRRRIQESIDSLDSAMLTSVEGFPASDPIFVVGMPRSGSTLVEQILASHSLVEGTMELPDMMEIAARLTHEAERAGVPYHTALRGLSVDRRRALGEEYLARTRVQRKTDRPYFIDKMPNNWEHVGLIRLILPNARIIDTRRHPIGCCFSMWKQHFARGQAFSYDLMDVASYYSDYVASMDHFEAVAPGIVHRVIYEHVVEDTDEQIAALLNYLKLPFEEGCQTFWQNTRAVRTASSEQVRRPIFSDAVEHWRNFAQWLKPLIDELEPLTRSYPKAQKSEPVRRRRKYDPINS